jgi:hypothetical protein
VTAGLTRMLGRPIVAIVGLTMVLYVLAVNSSLYYWGDDAHYMIVAKAISSGEGLRDILFPGEPAFAYPAPLFPALLAPLVALFGFALTAPKILVLLAAVAAVYCSYRLFRCYVEEPTALAMTVMTAVSPQLVSFSHQVMTEVPYLLISLAALLSIGRYAAPATRWLSPAFAVTTALLLAAILTRSVGFALLAAALAYMVLEGGGERALRIRKAAGIALLCAAGWLAVNFSTLGRIPYVSEFREGASGQRGTQDAELVERVRSNLDGYADALPEVLLYELFHHPAAAVSALLLACVGVGFVGAMLRHRTVVEYYMALYAGLLLAYPPSNPGNLRRYLVPLIPFIVLYFVLGVRYAVEGLRRAVRREEGTRRRSAAGRLLDVPATGVAVAVVAALTAVNLVATARASVLQVRPEMFDYRRFGEFDSHWAMARWARSHTPPGSVVATPQPYAFYFWSRRQVTWPPALPAGSGDGAAVRGIVAADTDYVAVDDAGRSDGAALSAVLERNPGAFVRVYRRGPNAMYRVVGARGRRAHGEATSARSDGPRGRDAERLRE